MPMVEPEFIVVAVLIMATPLSSTTSIVPNRSHIDWVALVSKPYLGHNHA